MMNIIIYFTDNAAVFAALFSGLGIMIAFGIYRQNSSQLRFMKGEKPVFEFTFEPIAQCKDWVEVTVVARNRAPSMLEVRGACVSKLTRVRLLARTQDDHQAEPDIKNAKRDISLYADALPVGRETTLNGRAWKSADVTLSFFLYTPSRRATVFIIWRSRTSSRWYKSVIRIIKPF